MDIRVKPGKYILAVSGGVDSMVLLDVLALLPNVELIVAHFNHNMRSDSREDQKLVQQTARQLNLIFETNQAAIGELVSENDARIARYDFLFVLKKKYAADAILTAHHQDDKLETALLNVIRGTGRRGLSAISDNKIVIRPLLNTSKIDIVDYAITNKLKWREDSTNNNMNFRRNYLRTKLLKGFDKNQKQEFIEYIEKVAITNTKIDTQIATISQIMYNNNQFNRQQFALLPDEVGKELLVYWLNLLEVREFERPTVERLSLAIKTAKLGSTFPIKQDCVMFIEDNSVHFSNTL